MRNLLLSLLAAGVLTLAIGCGSSRDLPERIKALQASKNPEVLRVGVYGDPHGLHPFDPFETTAAFVAGMVHAGPLRRNGQGEFSGNLWATWTAVVSNDNLVVEGEWRPNLRWHDGQPFSPEDLAFTLERMKNPRSNSVCQTLAENVVKVETLDGGRRSRVEFKGTSRQYLHLLAVGLLPRHLLEQQPPGKEQIEVVRDPLASTTITGFRAAPAMRSEKGADTGTGASVAASLASTPVAESPGMASGSNPSIMDFSRVPVGLGPYRVVGRKPNQFIELAYGPVGSGRMETGVAADASANASAGASASASSGTDLGEPRLKQVLVRVYYAPDELVSDIRNAKLDYSFLPPHFVTRIQELKIPGARMIGHPNPSYLMLAYNTRKPPLDNREIRHALDLAINRKRLAEVISMPGAILTTPPILPEEQTVGLQKREFDLLQAEEILTRSGLTDTNGDRIKDWAGKPLTLTLVTNGENFLRKSLAEKIAQDLQVVGIRTVVETVDWSDLFEKRLASGTFDLLLMAYHAPADGNWITLWHSAPPLGDRLNVTGFSTPELDRLLEDLDRWPPASGSDSLRQRLASLLHEEVPGSFLYHPADVVAVTEGLSGPTETGDIWEQDVTTWERVPASPGAN